MVDGYLVARVNPADATFWQDADGLTKVEVRKPCGCVEQWTRARHSVDVCAEHEDADTSAWGSDA